MDTSSEIFSELRKFEKEIISVEKNPLKNAEEIIKLSDNFRKIKAKIIADETSPKSVTDIVLTNKSDKNITINKEYLPLIKYLKLKEKYNKLTREKLKIYLTKNNHKKALKNIVQALKVSPENVTLLDILAKEFKKHKLYDELIEIYKLDFIYTLSPKYFEKIGDIYYKQKEYEKAQEQYFNYAENSKQTPQIYKKLAKTFEAQNDKNSMNACLEQAKLLEAGHG